MYVYFYFIRVFLLHILARRRFIQKYLSNLTAIVGEGLARKATAVIMTE